MAEAVGAGGSRRAVSQTNDDRGLFDRRVRWASLLMHGASASELDRRATAAASHGPTATAVDR